jgi:hypothetical protein
MRRSAEVAAGVRSGDDYAEGGEGLFAVTGLQCIKVFGQQYQTVAPLTNVDAACRRAAT